MKRVVFKTVWLLAVSMACEASSQEKARALLEEGKACSRRIEEERTLAASDYDCAVAPLDRAVKLDPNNADIRYERGMLFMSLGKIEQAIADFSHCLTVSPTSSWCLSWRARAHAERGAFKIAARDCEQLLRREGKGQEHPDGWSECAEYRWAAGDREGALALLLEFVKEYETRDQIFQASSPHRLLSRYHLSLGKVPEALHYGKLAFEHPKRVPRDCEDYALALEASGNFSSALRVAEEGLAMNNVKSLRMIAERLKQKSAEKK